MFFCKETLVIAKQFLTKFLTNNQRQMTNDEQQFKI